MKDVPNSLPPGEAAIEGPGDRPCDDGAVAPPENVDAAKRGSPVFIVGGRRSGSSLLYRALQQHPSFRLERPHLVESHVFGHVAQTHRFEIGKPPSLWTFMVFDEARYRDFLEQLRAVRLLHRLTAPIGRRLSHRPATAWSFVNRHHVVAREYFARAWLARGCTRLVEKTPTNVPHAAKLVAAFPRAQLLYISRHPVETYASYRRRLSADPEATWARITVDEFCRYYETETHLLRRHVERGLRLRLIRYEDLTRDPEPTMRSLLDFLGESFDPVTLEPYARAATPWDPQLGGEISVPSGDWRRHLEPHEARLIEGRLADALGWRGHRSPAGAGT